MRTFLIAALVLPLSMTACATQTGIEAASRFDDFEARGRLASDGAALSRYDSVYLAPIALSEDLLDRIDRPVFGSRSANDGGFAISRATAEEKAADLREDLERELASVATLTGEPGPGVLSVAIVVEQLRSNRPTIDALREEPSLDSRSFGIGGAAVTATLSADGEVLAVIEDDNRQYNIDDPAIGVGFWTTADRFFERFSDKLAALLS